MSEQHDQAERERLRTRIKARRADRARSEWGTVEMSGSAAEGALRSAGAAPEYVHGYGGWTATVGPVATNATAPAADVPPAAEPAAESVPATAAEAPAVDPAPAAEAATAEPVRKPKLGDRLKSRLRPHREGVEEPAETAPRQSPAEGTGGDAPELAAARERLRRRAEAGSREAEAGDGAEAATTTSEAAPPAAAEPAPAEEAAAPSEPVAPPAPDPKLPVPPRARMNDRAGNSARGKGGRFASGTDEPDDDTQPGARNRRSQRIGGGGTVMIGDALYPLLDWSMGGIAISPGRQDIVAGERRRLEVELDMRDYAVSLDMEGEAVTVTADRIGFRFVDPTDRQKQVLRALTNAAVQGRSFAPPLNPGHGVPVIDNEGRDARRTVPPRRRLSPLAALMSLPFNAAVIALVAGAAIFALPDKGGSSSQSVGSVAAGPIRAEHAAVAVERQALTANATGVVLEWGYSPGESVSEGDALVSVMLGTGGESRAVVESPCDCNLARILVEAGDRVVEGDVIALLYPRDAEGHVQAMFPFGTAPNPGDSVSVALPYSGDRFEGVVDKVGRLDDPQDYIGLPTAIIAGDRTAVFARIKTSPPVPAALAGDPAVVTVGAMDTRPPEV